MPWMRAVIGWVGLGLLAATVPAKTLLVLPVTGESGVGSGELAAVNRLFRDALEARHGSVVAAPSTVWCGERGCALEAAEDAELSKSDEVVYSSLERLGEKLIFLATIVRADGKKPYNQRMTVVTIEDMEPVTQRMAEALVTRTAPEFAASVDDVTEREKTHERARRKTPYSMGFSLGYLTPIDGGFNYYKEDANNPGYPYTLTDYAALPRVGWINTWEFRRDTHLDLEAVWTAPGSFGGDLNLTYLLGGGDFSPFFGGGIGLHYVHKDEDPALSEHRPGGPALNGQAGVVLFRTYGMNVKIRGQYLAVFNTDGDQGFALDVGVTFH